MTYNFKESAALVFFFFSFKSLFGGSLYFPLTTSEVAMSEIHATFPKFLQNIKYYPDQGYSIKHNRHLFNPKLV